MLSDPTSIVVVGLGVIISLLGGIFGLALAIKQLFFTKPEPGRELVTREELSRTVQEINGKFEKLAIEVNTKIDRLDKDLLSRMEKLDGYTHQTAHSHSTSMQTLMLKVERLLVLQEKKPLSAWPQVEPPDVS